MSQTDCTDASPIPNQCHCDKHRPIPARRLNDLQIECWLRRYDRRPYNTLLLNRRLFELHYHRQPDHDDFCAITAFLCGDNTDAKRAPHPIERFELIYVPLPSPASDVCERLLRRVAMMTHASLCHVDLQPDHLRILLTASSAPSLIGLRSLRLSGNPFGGEHAAVLREFLLHNRTIAYLDIGYCSINAVQLATIADGMLHCVSLRAIDLSRLVPLHSAHSVDATGMALVLAQLMWPRGKLYEVHAKHNAMDGHDIAPIIECLERCSNLVYLDLGSNRLGARGMRDLVEALQRSPCLIGLDVSCNGIGEHGGLAIAHGLSATRIRYLDIGRNGIPAAVMRLLLNTLRKSHPVRILNVVGNEFDYQVGGVLRRMLDARVLMLDGVDVRTTYDADEDAFRVVPCENRRSGYNYRYMRVQPFLRPYDVAPNLMWHDENRQQLLVNGLFVDAIYVDAAGRVYALDRNGEKTSIDDTEIYNF